MDSFTETARQELASFGDALLLAERGAPRQPVAALLARLMRVAALHPRAIDPNFLLQIEDLVSGELIGERFKVNVLRMGWAAIVQAEFKTSGLRAVGAAAPVTHAKAA